MAIDGYCLVHLLVAYTVTNRSLPGFPSLKPVRQRVVDLDEAGEGERLPLHVELVFREETGEELASSIFEQGDNLCRIRRCLHSNFTYRTDV